MTSDNPVIVRSSHRYELALPARLRLEPEDAEQVRHAASAPLRGGWLTADLFDVSRGGIGLVTAAFIPRRARVRVRVFGFSSAGFDTPATAQADPAAAPLLDVLARVQRVIMTDRRPAYLIGTEFPELTAENHAELDTLLAELDAMHAPPAPGAHS